MVARTSSRRQSFRRTSPKTWPFSASPRLRERRQRRPAGPPRHLRRRWLGRRLCAWKTTAGTAVRPGRRPRANFRGPPANSLPGEVPLCLGVPEFPIPLAWLVSCSFLWFQTSAFVRHRHMFRDTRNLKSPRTNPIHRNQNGPKRSVSVPQSLVSPAC